MEGNNKRIAKNSLFLYVRMLLNMGIGLYTSRVVLNTLGIEDFGVYSIVGGVVSMFGFLNSAMSSATQRYLSFEIGKKDISKLSKTFSISLSIHILIGIIVLILAETVGLWFVNNRLNVPLDRMSEVNWVYQFSILTFLFGIIQVPYNALIIAHERMNVYAYISIFEVLSKLFVVYILVILDYDKLKLYAVLLFIVSFLIRMIEKYYCKTKFPESKYNFVYDKMFFKEMLNYAGWNLFGNFAAIARGQGNNILLNIFYGPVLNAAYGITLQLQGAVLSFMNSFQTAINPQIIKSYASDNKDDAIRLIMQSSKFSFFLMSIFVFPILFNTKYVMELWLKNIPDYTILFVQLSLIGVLIDTISGSLMTGIQATGKIKGYQSVVGTLVFLNLPFSYLGIVLWNIPQIIFITSIVISFISLFFRLYFLFKAMDFSVLNYSKDVLAKIAVITIIMTLIYFILENNFELQYNNFFSFIAESIVIEFILIVLIYSIGLKTSEREIGNNILKKIILRK